MGHIKKERYRAKGGAISMLRKRVETMDCN